MEHSDRARQTRELERFLIITDGVVAIAITLLVLPLIEAVTSSERENDTVEDILSSLGWEFFSFFLSFFVIAIIWKNHRAVFESVGIETPVLIWSGISWLLAVILIPFTTALIVEHGDEQHSLLVYLTNLLVCIACTGLATWTLYRSPELTTEGKAISWEQLGRSVINLCLVVLALAITWLIPLIGYWVMLLLVFDAPILKAIHARRGVTT